MQHRPADHRLLINAREAFHEGMIISLSSLAPAGARFGLK
jgi:hypothetical protein